MRAVTFLLRSCILAVASSSLAAGWFVGPEGAPANPGTREAPWDIASALDGKQKVAPGDTLTLLAGTYKRRPKEQFDVRLVGTEEKPIHVRPAPGARATIDGGLAVQAPSAHVWIWDLEVLVSEPNPEKIETGGSHPKDFDRPWGGLNMFGGRNCKYIHLAIHDTRQGISCWTGEKDCEIYGCVIYDNGWLAPDRGHGHCIYTQNKDGVKTIANCILTCRYPGTYTMHAYGSSRADVDNYLLTDNIAYGLGTFLVGSGKPSHNIRVLRNCLHDVSMQIGYNAPENEDCEVRDNVIVNGGLSINKYKKAVNEGNLVLAKGAKRPPGAKIVLLPSKYDPSRAHLAVYNWEQAREVQVPVAPFLKPGDSFRLYDPKGLFGKPVLEGKCGGEAIAVPVSGEFAVFVLFKEK
ncbi:MAG TPA: hypothetical protein PLE19_23375 [Planctomycetota bacterium]|nr:hypothetical protein [Planctomycetota bacterium]HRR82021.1 hypothetical protein [Planctomycetota bacterium]HRT95100.1 hypothetical protein [Planctomycetota bacterium]